MVGAKRTSINASLSPREEDRYKCFNQVIIKIPLIMGMPIIPCARMKDPRIRGKLKTLYFF